MGKKCAQAMNLETQPTRKDQHTHWLKSVQLRKKLTRASTHMRRNVEPKTKMDATACRSDLPYTSQLRNFKKKQWGGRNLNIYKHMHDEDME